MSSKPIYLMSALTLIILLTVLYLGYELIETRSENQVLVQKLLQAKHQGASKEEKESYLKGPVKNTIVKHAGLIQECFLSMIERSPDIQESGKVLIDWQIDSSGKVFGAGVVRDDFLNKDFQSCLQTNISRIAFPIPPSRNPVYVEHTFLFKNEEKK